MLISEVIEQVKRYCKGSWMGMKIDDEKTRDKILYGDPDQECTGIVTTIYASVDVIRKAHELGANLIIAHEALLWNHGDHREWLEESQNRTYLEKKKLMDDYQIVVWRFHDYIHSGIPYKDSYIDGIFYGLAQVTGWEDAIINNSDISGALYLECEETTPRQVGRLIMEKWHLNGLKCIGNMDAKVTKIMVCGHVMEGGDSDSLIRRIDKEDINLLLPLELIDFTLTEYIKDSGQLGMNRAILAAGHFNLEEPGMKYILHWIDDALKEHIDTHYVQAGDMYTYM
ncbi:MAG: Nif3-like dinuclear metal center hexameric protein [Erysipelotrichaceae bacterium]|nr:Nif3-like dinuclear metal center hexameric protein [Erysipelotrichaceae bacterium]